MNIYDYIEMNYIQEPELEQLLSQKLIMDFFRRQAWKGFKDEALRNIWRDIYAYILGNAQTNQVIFKKNNLDSVRNCIAWLNTYALDFEVTHQSLRRFLDNVQLLQEYLLKTKYPINEYINFSELYESFIDIDGNINVNFVAHNSYKSNKVVHIDFKYKKTRINEFAPKSISTSKQLIYIREHVVDFSNKIFDEITNHQYAVVSDKLFNYYDIYWNRYVEAKLVDIAYDDAMLQEFSMNIINNVLPFVEYLAFGATLTKDKGLFIRQVIESNKSDVGFVRFIERYRGAQLRFFKITGQNDLGTGIKDVLTGDTFYLEDIAINHCEKTEVFTAYFNPQNDLLPSITISLQMNDVQIITFQNSIKKICHYMLGEQASINEFLNKHDLLARYIWVVVTQNKRIDMFLKRLVPTQSDHCVDYSNCVLDDDQKKHMQEMVEGSFVNEHEKSKFMQLWHDLYPKISTVPNFAEYFRTYLITAIKVFSDLNQPSDGPRIEDFEYLQNFERLVLLNELKELDKSLEKYNKEVVDYLELDGNKMCYMTELGMINFIDKLIDKG